MLKKTGFTIIETVVVLGIFSLIIVVLGSIFVWQSNLFSVESGAIDAERAHNTSLERFSQDVREARAVFGSISGFTSGANVIILETPLVPRDDDVDGAGGGTDFDYIIYYYNAGKLMRRIIAHSDSTRVSGTQTLNSYVRSLQFNYNATPVTNSTVVTMSLESYTRLRRGERSIINTVRVELRNKAK